MNVSPQAQAVLLLTAHFSKPRPNEAKPLTPTEWGKFALWMRDEKMGPEALLAGNLRQKLSSWTDPKIPQDRIDRLLGRGSALALAVEKWTRGGLWILTRSDAAYPSRLKQRLKLTAPAVLFGCGNVSLLGQGGVAVVGSRDTSNADLSYAKRLGARVALAGASVVSGGARGIDEAAMEGALDAGGTAIGVLADGLLHASSSANYRKQLLADTLVLLSPFYPEAGFNVGNAMARNKYIYCLADAAVVVHSGTSGGTWSGALENLEKKWVPTWVKRTDDAAAGNVEIETRGASWLPEKAEEVDVAEILSVATGPTRPQPVKQGGNVAESAATYRPRSSTPEPKDLSFYEFFLSKVEQVCGHVPRTMADLQKELDVTKAQLAAWLKRAVAEKKLRKVTRPVRYEWVGEDRQRSIF